MKITIVGVALIIGAVVLAAVLVRTLADQPQPAPEAS
jgi:hypothetical protein